MQGESQFYANVMQFSLGSDGKQCWWQYASTDGSCAPVELAALEAIDERNVSICDPFHLVDRAPTLAAEEQHLEYEGMSTLNSCQCHVIKSTAVKLANSYVQASILRCWIDAELFIPVQVVEDRTFGRTLRTFVYDRLNEPIPDAEFAPPSADESALRVVAPLAEDDTTRHVIVKDGSDGHMSVRWGTNRQSSGLD